MYWYNSSHTPLHTTQRTLLPIARWAIVFVLLRGLFAAGALPTVQRMLEVGASVPNHVEGHGEFVNDIAYFSCIRKVCFWGWPVRGFGIVHHSLLFPSIKLCVSHHNCTACTDHDQGTPTCTWAQGAAPPLHAR